jgi:hypothetical protein
MGRPKPVESITEKQRHLERIAEAKRNTEVLPGSRQT